MYVQQHHWFNSLPFGGNFKHRFNKVKVEKKEIKAEIKNDEGAGLVGGGGVVVLEESDEEIR